MNKNSRRRFIKQVGMGSFAMTSALKSSAIAESYYEKHELPMSIRYSSTDKGESELSVAVSRK